MAWFALSGFGGAAGTPEYPPGKPGAAEDPKVGCVAGAAGAPPNGGTSGWVTGACSGALASLRGATNGLSLLMIPPREKQVDLMNENATVSRSRGRVSIRFVRPACSSRP